jgi:hypothetical protein
MIALRSLRILRDTRAFWPTLALRVVIGGVANAESPEAMVSDLRRVVRARVALHTGSQSEFGPWSVS